MLSLRLLIVTASPRDRKERSCKLRHCVPALSPFFPSTSYCAPFIAHFSFACALSFLLLLIAASILSLVPPLLVDTVPVPDPHLAMTEVSKGRQPSMSHKPSPLSHMQVPGSDGVVPNTQLNTDGSHYGSELRDDELLSQADRALLERTAIKAPGNATTSSRSFSPAPQAFGLVKPNSAPIESAFNFVARRPTNKTSPKEDAPTVQPSVHPDVVIPSIEHVDNGAPKQRMAEDNNH